MPDYAIFELDTVNLQSRVTLHNVQLAYKTYGKLDPTCNNVVFMPTFYGGQHAEVEGMIEAGRALDPERYYIIVPNMFGNGLSSSPSNTPPPFDRAAFPNMTLYDNVSCQHRLITERLGISQIKLVVGFSMAAQQAFHWGAVYPDMVEAIAPICGSARTSLHNFLFLEGVKAALLADAAFADGWYAEPPVIGSARLQSCVCGVVIFTRLLPRTRVPQTRVGFCRRQRAVCRRILSAARCERSAGDAVDVAACGYQRQPAI
jgi:homoserine O-acetyltransferase